MLPVGACLQNISFVRGMFVALLRHAVSVSRFDGSMRRHRGKSFTASHAFIAPKAFFCKRRRSTALRQTREANEVSSGPVAQVECTVKPSPIAQPLGTTALLVVRSRLCHKATSTPYQGALAAWSFSSHDGRCGGAPYSVSGWGRRCKTCLVGP